MINLVKMRDVAIRVFLIVVMSNLMFTVVQAGVQTEEEVKREISYLAMTLLKIKGQDSYTLESEALVKPYIGVCSKMKPKGVYLACVTPKSQAAKAGLKTGDVILSINGISMANQSEHYDPNKAYWKLTDEMKVGDKLKLVLADGDKTRQMTVSVGSLSHPAYRIEISKTKLSAVE